MCVALNKLVNNQNNATGDQVMDGWGLKKNKIYTDLLEKKYWETKAKADVAEIE